MSHASSLIASGPIDGHDNKLLDRPACRTKVSRVSSHWSIERHRQTVVPGEHPTAMSCNNVRAGFELSASSYHGGRQTIMDTFHRSFFFYMCSSFFLPYFTLVSLWNFLDFAIFEREMVYQLINLDTCRLGHILFPDEHPRARLARPRKQRKKLAFVSIRTASKKSKWRPLFQFFT